MRRSIAMVLLVAYLVVLFDLVLVRFPQPGPPPNLVPLAMIAHYWAEGGRGLLVNLVGNVAAFVPLGLLVPWIRTRRTEFREVVLLGLGLSLAIEMLQYASGRRVADVDDVLLNTVGALLGYLAYRALLLGPISAAFRRAAVQGALRAELGQTGD